ncbi:NUDIX domain-containing protein [Bacillus salipaludis]|uniref:NUDIX hydrolase n=1 Tax=Bacillus salipaludis TaxID=2547811 RepID=UPI003D1E4BD1
MNKIVVVVKGLIFHNGKVLVVQRARTNKIGHGIWECAGGKIEFGEDLEAALRREVKEETGLEIKVGKVLFATTFKNEPSKQLIILTYQCASENCEVTLSEEHTSHKWVSKEEIKEFLKPEIFNDFEKNQVFALKEWE